MTRGPYARGRASRELILETALDVISRKGYNATSLKDIAADVGMTQAGLLHHFGTKENLLLEVLQARDEANRTQLLGEPNDEDLPLILRLARHNVTVPGVVQLYVSLEAAAADPAHPAHDFFRERSSVIVPRIAADIRSRQEAGRFRRDADPELIAHTLLALSDGLQAKWLIDPTTDLPGILRAYWDQFVLIPAPAL